MSLQRITPSEIENSSDDGTMGRTEARNGSDETCGANTQLVMFVIAIMQGVVGLIFVEEEEAEVEVEEKDCLDFELD